MRVNGEAPRHTGSFVGLIRREVKRLGGGSGTQITSLCYPLLREKGASVPGRSAFAAPGHVGQLTCYFGRPPPPTPALPAAATRAYRLWFALGWPAFGALTGVFWLMVAKPPLW